MRYLWIISTLVWWAAACDVGPSVSHAGKFGDGLATAGADPNAYGTCPVIMDCVASCEGPDCTSTCLDGATSRGRAEALAVLGCLDDHGCAASSAGCRYGHCLDEVMACGDCDTPCGLGTICRDGRCEVPSWASACDPTAADDVVLRLHTCVEARATVRSDTCELSGGGWTSPSCCQDHLATCARELLDTRCGDCVLGQAVCDAQGFDITACFAK